MENTIENARAFFNKQSHRGHAIDSILVAYASACSAPSSIGEDEKNRIVQEVMEMHPYKVPGKPHTYSDYNQGWEDACDILDQHLTKWAISRLSERKIVLPSEEWMRENKNTKSMSEAYAVGKLYGIDLILSEIKRLNGIN